MPSYALLKAKITHLILNFLFPKIISCDLTVEYHNYSYLLCLIKIFCYSKYTHKRTLTHTQTMKTKQKNTYYLHTYTPHDTQTTHINKILPLLSNNYIQNNKNNKGTHSNNSNNLTHSYIHAKIVSSQYYYTSAASRVLTMTLTVFYVKSNNITFISTSKVTNKYIIPQITQKLATRSNTSTLTRKLNILPPVISTKCNSLHKFTVRQIMTTTIVLKNYKHFFYEFR